MEYPLPTSFISASSLSVTEMKNSCHRSGKEVFGKMYCFPLSTSHHYLSLGTVPTLSRHWSCQSGESNLRARISGDVQAGISLRRVNSIRLRRRKGSPRSAVKLLLRKFNRTVSNVLQKSSLRKPSPLKITI